MSKRIKQLCAAGLLLALSLSTAQEQVPVIPPTLLQNEQPVELSADSMDYDYREGRSIYRGNVVIRNGDLYFSGDRAELLLKDNVFVQFLLSGSPSVMHNKGAPQGEQIDVRAQRMDYDNVNQVIQMSGNVVVHYGDNIFEGDYVIYDVAEKMVRAPKSKNKDRVHFTIQPKSGQANK